MLHNIVIRPMELGDVVLKGYVHWKSCLDTYTGLMDPEVVARWSPEVYQRIAERFWDTTLVAERNGRVVGFGCWEPDGLISALYILPEEQGHGIGRLLMDGLLERLSGCGRVRLQVLEGNDNAIGFYEHLGFRLTGEQEMTKFSAVLPALWMERTV